MGIIGEKFGNWTIVDEALDRVDTNGKHHKQYWVECDCGRTRIKKDLYKLEHGAKMCKKCYLEILPQNGVPFERRPNKYDLSGDFGVGWTHNTGNEFYFDLADYDLVKNYTWYESQTHYVWTTLNTTPQKILKMHQLLCCAGCDHIDRNPMNNRRDNLRECTQVENTRNRSLSSVNTSGVTGVSFDKTYNKWVAYIACNGVLHNLGKYDSKDDAIAARLKAEKELFKDFAPQKGLFETYGI